MAKGDQAQSQTNAQQGADTVNQYRNQFQGNLQPVQNQMGYNYAQGSTSDMGNQADIMGMYRQIASGELGTPGRTGVGYVGNMDYLNSPGTFTAHDINYTDPFNSYGGYQKFSTEGGYSPTDVANLRARGTAPIRAAYGNAQREVNRQRALGGGYSPNMTAALGKMAREQGQSMADAQQNVEGGIVNQRNANMLSGLGGMSGIEQQRLQAELAKNEFNATQAQQAESGNINQQWALEQANSAIQGRNLDRQQSVAGANASIGNAAAEADMRNRLAALSGMTNLYGTTPGQSATFGNQLLSSINAQGQYDTNALNALSGFNRNQIAGSNIPSTWQNVQGNIGWGANLASPLINYYRNRQPPSTPTNGGFTGGYNPGGYDFGSNTSYPLDPMMGGNNNLMFGE